MKEFFKAVPVTDKVYWVGAIDWNLRSFHGYKTGRGSTYNAFLVLDEKITLIDTVKAPFCDELLARISSVIDPRKIDYIVSNHAEGDHSGSLLPVMAEVKPEKLFASPMGEKALREHYGDELPITAVKTGDSIRLGKNFLHFIETKMLHWPDSMVSFLDGENVMFSQDAFGMHLAGSQLWSDEYDEGILRHEARKYIANILLLQAQKLSALLAAPPEAFKQVKVLAPDHGPLHRGGNIGKILNWYAEAAAQPMLRRALVFYSSMWHSCEKLGAAVADGIRSAGVPVEVIDLAVSERSEIITQVLDSGLVVAGTPTMNNQMYPAMADVLTYMKGLKPQNHLGMAFGSYGWSGEGHKLLHAALAEMGFEMPLEPFAVKYVPTAADLEQAFAAGRRMAEMLIEKTR